MRARPLNAEPRPTEASPPKAEDQRQDPARPDAAGPESPVAWERLYREVGERVFRLLHRMTGNAEEAADLTHDAFVRMHQARHQFDQSGPAHAWAFRVAANIGRDALRRRKVRSAHARTEEREAATHMRFAAPQRTESTLAMQRALAALHHDYRTVLLLHDVDGYTHQEIAAMLAIAEGTSKARLSRARRAMRRKLEGKDS